MADPKHDHPTGHRTGRHLGRRSLVLILAVTAAIAVVIAAVIAAFPSWPAISLGAAHGVALALVAVIAAVLLVAGRLRRRKRTGGTAMLTTETRIETTNASRYLVHRCQHATKIGARSGPATRVRTSSTSSSPTHTGHSS